MKFWHNDYEYTVFSDLEFAPEISLLSDTIPINNFSVNLKKNASDSFQYGDHIALANDSGVIYANYYVCEFKDIDENFIYIKANDCFYYLDAETMPATYLNNVDFKTYLRSITNFTFSIPVDDTYPNITGYCPEQTKRERIQYVCFVVGAFIQTCMMEETLPGFSTDMYVKKVATTFNADIKHIRQSDVFYEPSIGGQDVYTYITCTDFRVWQVGAGVIDVLDEYVEVTEAGTTSYYMVLRNNLTYNRPNPITGLNPKAIDIEDNYLINDVTNFWTDVMLRVVLYYYFNGLTVEASVRNPETYKLGDYVSLYIGDRGSNDEMIEGYVISQDFSFSESGDHTAKIKVWVTNKSTPRKLIVSRNYTDEYGISRYIDHDEYMLMAGDEVNIPLDYIDTVDDEGVRRIFQPNSSSALVIMPDFDYTVYLEYNICMEIKDGVVYIKKASDVLQSYNTLVISGENEDHSSDDELDVINYEDALFISDRQVRVTGAKRATESQGVLTIE